MDCVPAVLGSIPGIFPEIERFFFLFPSAAVVLHWIGPGHLLSWKEVVGTKCLKLSQKLHKRPGRCAADCALPK